MCTITQCDLPLSPQPGTWPNFLVPGQLSRSGDKTWSISVSGHDLCHLWVKDVIAGLRGALRSGRSLSTGDHRCLRGGVEKGDVEPEASPASEHTRKERLLLRGPRGPRVGGHKGRFHSSPQDV